MMMIIEIKSNKQPKDLPDKAKKALLGRKKFQTAEPRMLGTKVKGNKQIIMIYSEDLPEDLELFLNNNGNGNESGINIDVDPDGNETITNIDLGLTVLAREDEIVDQSLLLPYFEDVPVFNEEGEQTGTEEVTDLTDKLQVWAGKKWLYS